MGVETPCSGICKIDARSRLCIGCGRTIDEIGSWSGMSASERRDIMEQLAGRRADAGLDNGAAPDRRRVAGASP
jgi:predicted Fe-S protein YdhL (DUF1289 family)